MCRLFGLTAGTARVKATFWLLDAPDSLQVQSHRNADGAGLGFFGRAGEPVLDKQPEPAFRDQEFSREARQAESSAFVAHVRWATTGGRTVRNTHPFVMDGRVMAHNGGFGDLAQLDAELGRFASEQLDGESGWRMLAPGELVHVRPDLSVHSQLAIPQPPAHLVPLPAGSPNIDT
jgi:predicted glutamine amidotransferase